MRYYTTIKDEQHFNTLKKILNENFDENISNTRMMSLHWISVESYMPVAIYHIDNQFSGWDRLRDAENGNSQLKDLYCNIVPEDLFKI